ncbi:DUF3857 domain-containing protein [Flavobacterium sangjuense]|uniref:DUF3857 domain-containing protein n=1 Tax=Flavobacterium sangjuense TaxID=2518177 RepID=A0A4P7PSE1_9FLAO|nr:DUF3857 domain-containing protein [Flavobacterium sangjuense]QBZ97556.1 hypothetical protein GS03_01048 [Flavobacterium sangjuense]
MKSVLLLTVLFLSTFCYSQKHELGNVTIDELKEKVCPSDTSAVAAVLFNVGKTYFSYAANEGFQLKTEVIAKIKIYKKEGYDYANQSISYYSYGGDVEKVDVSKAVTYNLVNEKIEKTKLNSEGEFNEKVNKFYSRKKITMPKVKEGSVIEYKFEITSPFFSTFPEWQFQKQIPVNYTEFTTYIPEYFTYNISFKGFLTPVIEKNGQRKSFDINSKERTSRARITSTQFSTETTEYGESISKYTLSNVPALKEESFVNNIENYTATIEHELSAIQYPGGLFNSYATTWESVTKSIYENENFGDELNKDSYFEEDLKALNVGAVSDNETIAKVFDFVKSRMNWNEYNSVYCDVGVRTAYKNKTGNTAEINLILVAMLRKAGVNANPILVSTRANGISLFPSRTSYNCVIAGVESNGKMTLLDATNKNAQPNILPIRDLNWFGRLIKKDGTSVNVDLMPKSNSKDVVSIIASVNEKGEVTGKIRDQYFDYNAFLFRQTNNSISKDSYIEKLEKRHQGLEIGEYSVQNSNDLSLPVVENYDFTSTNSVEIIGDKMYVSPFLFFAITENPFKQEKREYPVDFVFPDQDKFNISLTIPPGYVVETLPQPKAMTMPENIGSFKYIISNTGNQIQLLYTHDTNQAIIGSEYYEALKNFYKEIVNKQTEKIVLKKA